MEENRFNRNVGTIGNVTLNSVHFTTDGQRGWAVGTQGAIVATHDGGQSWQPQTSGVTSQLRSVHFSADGQRGWAVGSEGAIVATRDGGQSWQPQASGVKRHLLSVQFSPDGQRGWAVGLTGTIIVTRDGGQNWQQQASGVVKFLASVQFNADGTRGWAVGEEGEVKATRDGGQSWQPQASGLTSPLENVHFSPDGQRGWTVGGIGTIIATRDGGQSWQPQASEVNSWLKNVHFSADGQRGWAVGTEGMIFATRDGGQSWQPQQSGVNNFLFSVHFNADGQRGWAVGNGGTIIATGDGGQSWQVMSRYARGVAPWYFLVTGLLLLVCVVLLVWRMRRMNQLGDRIAFEAIADAPLERADQDLLGFAPIADALAAFLRHEKTLPSLTIAFTAAWGQGKSSMMGLMRARLQAAGAPTVWFNAWHHQKEPVLLAALLSAVVAQGIPPWLTLYGLRFRSKLVWARFCKRPLAGAGPTLLFFGSGLAALCLAAWWLVTPALPHGDAAWAAPHPMFTQVANLVHDAIASVTGTTAVESLLSGEWARFVRESLGAFGQQPSKILPLVIAAAMLGSLFLLVTHFCRPFPANPGALLFSMGAKFSLSQAEDQTTLRQRFRDHFKDVTRALQPRTLTVFIDDLDRCKPAKSAEMLEAVNYLTDSGLCFVVLGMARAIVEAQLGETYGTLADRAAEFERARKAASPLPAEAAAPAPNSDPAQVRLDYARQYLKKLIQIEVPVPTFGAPQMRALLSRESAQAQQRHLAFHRFFDQAERWRADFWRTLRFLLPAIVIGWLSFQGWLWLQDKDVVAETAHNQGDQMVAKAEADLTAEARKYVLYLRREVALASAAAAPSQTAPATAAKAGSKPTPTAAASSALPLIERTSHLREAERWLEQAEHEADRMKEHQRIRQPEARDHANDNRQKAQTRLAALAKADQAYQQLIAAKTVAPGTKDTEGDALAPLRERPPGGASAAPAQNAIPFALAIPLGMLLIVGAAGLLSRGRYVIVEGQTFKDALKQWQAVLLAHESMQAPREAKRFLNLSRYLTLRVNAAQYLGWSWWRRVSARIWKLESSAGAKAVDEAVIVALTTLLMTRPKHVQGASIGQFLRDPRAFLNRIDHPTDADAHYVQAVGTALGAAGGGAAAPTWSVENVAHFLNAAGELKQS